MIRLALLLSLSATTACGSSEQEPPVPAPVETRALAWTGTVRAYVGTQTNDRGVSTQVDPFTSARSESWPVAEGPAAKRVMTIDRTGGWIEREGRREPMSVPMLAHERQQFAIYGLMQQALPLARPKGEVTLGGSSPFIPATIFRFDKEGTMIEARNEVSDPNGGSTPIAQRFRFIGEIQTRGLRWPRRIEITHIGEPHLTLEIDRLRVGK